MPYRERIQPGDLSPGDLLPVSDDDPRLVPTYSFGDDPLDADDKAQIREVAQDLGLGRVRTLSVEGRELAAQRWYDGDGGPDAPIAQSAPDHVLAPAASWSAIAGPLAETFGVCANGDANDDGRVVSFDHGCGAHSEVRLAKKHEPQPLPDPVFDTLDDRRGRVVLTHRPDEGRVLSSSAPEPTGVRDEPQRSRTTGVRSDSLRGSIAPARALRRRRQYSMPNRPSPNPARQVHSHQVRPSSSSRP